MTFQLTFSRRQAQQGRYGFEVQAESDVALVQRLRERFADSLLRSVYHLFETPLRVRDRKGNVRTQLYRVINLRRRGSAEITQKDVVNGLTHTAGVPGPPDCHPAHPGEDLGSADHAAVTPPEAPCLAHQPGPSRRRPGSPSIRRQRRDGPPETPTAAYTIRVGRCDVTLVPHRAVVDRLEETFGVELPAGPAWWEWVARTSDHQVELRNQGSARTHAAALRAARAAAVKLCGELARRAVQRAAR
jgi:hypothetical protein